MKELDRRTVNVAFGNEKLYADFQKLHAASFEDETLYKEISKALDRLKENPFCGIKIPRKLWPKEYGKKFGIDNLWKYDLHNGWRLIYTIKGDAVSIVAIILEWFGHKNYEKRFGYKSK